MSARHPLNFQKNLIAGLLAITPLVMVWLVFDFFYSTLSSVGRPVANGLIGFVDDHFPPAAIWLADPDIQRGLAFLTAILLLYTIGAGVNRVIGKRLMGYIERLIARVPIAQSIYSATKKLVDVLQQKPDSGSRVVLIDFPQPGMRAIGFLMRTFKDVTTGEELAAVYVPTAPNPTCGYLEIIRPDRLFSTDLSMDQAMAMILSGGATAPERIVTGPIL